MSFLLSPSQSLKARETQMKKLFGLDQLSRFKLPVSTLSLKASPAFCYNGFRQLGSVVNLECHSNVLVIHFHQIQR